MRFTVLTAHSRHYLAGSGSCRMSTDPRAVSNNTAVTADTSDAAIYKFLVSTNIFWPLWAQNKEPRVGTCRAGWEFL